MFRTRQRRLPLLLSLPLLGGIMATTPAWGLGLGAPLNNPVVGQPLRIDIPISIGAGETVPGADCARISLPAGSPDRQFFPASARISIESGSPPRIRIQSSSPVAEPMLEFRVSIGCGASIARDYLVLSDSPRPASASPAPAAPGPDPARDSAPKQANDAVLPPDIQRTLTLTHDTTLNVMARGRYPGNQATRDEYRRMMAAANPELFAGQTRVGSVPLPAGTVLNIPRGLPPVEQRVTPGNAGPGGPAGDVAPPPKAPPKSPAPQREAATVTAAPRKGTDRLVLSGNTTTGLPAMTPREISNAVERMERMVEDQGRTTLEQLENLKTLNAAFIGLKNHVEQLEARIRQEEEARRNLAQKLDQLAAQKQPGLLELLAAIVASGLVGAGLLTYYQRRQTTTTMPAPAAAGEPAMTEPAPAPAAPPGPAVPPAPAAVPPAPSIAVREALPEVPAAAEPAVPATLPVLDAKPERAPELDLPLEFPSFATASPSPSAPSVPAEIEFSPPGASASSTSTGHAAIELADIMTSMGLGKEAVRSLVEHIHADPKSDLGPWFKAFDIYRKTGQRDEFEALAENLRKHLNVQPAQWDESFHPDTRSLTDFRHLAQRLIELWPTPECATFLEELLLDNREGVRQGFPHATAEEIMLLQRVLALRE